MLTVDVVDIAGTTVATLSAEPHWVSEDVLPHLPTAGSLTRSVLLNGTCELEGAATLEDIGVISGSHLTLVRSRLCDLMLTTSKDRTVRIWDLESGSCLETWQGDDAAFSHDGDLAFVVYNRTVDIWELSSGSAIRAKILEGHGKPICSAAFSQDDARVVTASADFTAKLWDVQSGECLQSLYHMDGVVSAVFSHDGSRILTASEDWTAKVWDSESGTNLKTFQGPTSAIWVAILSPDASRALTVSHSGSVQQQQLWDVTSCRCLETFNHRDGVGLPRDVDAVFSHDGTRVFTTCLSSASVFDSNSGERLKSFRLDGRPLSVSACRIITSSGFAVNIWDWDTGECSKVLESHQKAVVSAFSSQDSARVLLVSTDFTAISDFTAILLDVQSGECLQTFVTHEHEIVSAVFAH